MLTGKQWEEQCCWMLGSRGDPLLKLKPAAEPRHGDSVIAFLHRLFFPLCVTRSLQIVARFKIYDCLTSPINREI